MRVLQLADEELVAFFTASCGGRAQSYERSFNGEASPSSFDEVMVTQIDRARFSNRGTPISEFDTTKSTLASIDAGTREVLRLVYEPFGTGFSVGVYSESKRGRKKKVDDDVETPDRLAMVLRPSWGGGSFVRLAVLVPEAIGVYRKQFAGKEPSPSELRAYLIREAREIGSDRKPLFSKLRRVCESSRTVALKVYDAARQSRVRMEKATRERERQIRQAERESLLRSILSGNRTMSRG